MKNGFTLIELMIVVAIIGILLAIAIPAFQNYSSNPNTPPRWAIVCEGLEPIYTVLEPITSGNTISYRARGDHRANRIVNRQCEIRSLGE